MILGLPGYALTIHGSAVSIHGNEIGKAEETQQSTSGNVLA